MAGPQSRHRVFVCSPSLAWPASPWGSRGDGRGSHSGEFKPLSDAFKAAPNQTPTRKSRKKQGLTRTGAARKRIAAAEGPYIDHRVPDMARLTPHRARSECRAII